MFKAKGGWDSAARRCGVVALSLLAILFNSSAWSQEAPLRMALIPYLSPNVLIPLFQPLARHFEKEMGRPVELYSAPTIRAHVERISRPDFDIVFSAPHFGRLAQLDAGYVPIGSFVRPLTGVITVKAGGAIDSVDKLRGKTVAINDRLVLNSILTLHELEKRGIRLNDIRIVSAASQNSALLSVAAGDVDAAVTVNFALGQIPKAKQAELHVLLQTEAVPNMPSTLILVNPAMAVKDRARLETALLGFAATEEGKKFLAASSYQDVVGIVPAHVKNLDVYLPELRRLLASGG